MLELQMQVLTLWHRAGEHLRAAQLRVTEDRDRGEVTATTALIVLLVAAALIAGGVIANAIISNANNVDSPSP